MKPDFLDSDQARRLEGVYQSFGEIINEALQSPDVVEISLNDDSTLWLEERGQAMRPVGKVTPAESRIIVEMVADFLDELVNKENPILNGELPDGSRFSAVIPPNVKAASFSIRRHLAHLVPLEDYVSTGIMPPVVYEAIRSCILSRKNIFLVGGTGSGKTTMVNSIINEVYRLCPEHRLLILEDTRELKSSSPNTLMMRTTRSASMQALIATSLRLRPDRIILGEVRTGEALDLLIALNTGHPGGICTFHANAAELAFTRLEEMVAMATPRPMQRLIGEAVDLIVFIENSRQQRRVREALYCHGYDRQAQDYKMEVFYETA